MATANVLLCSLVLPHQRYFVFYHHIVFGQEFSSCSVLQLEIFLWISIIFTNMQEIDRLGCMVLTVCYWKQNVSFIVQSDLV
jgi:hypothetical protein